MKNIRNKIYDVLIVGGGPAGLSAAIYAARYELDCVVISKSIGGTINLAPEIENWPGFVGTGVELIKKVRSQAESFGAKMVETEIISVIKDRELFVVKTRSKEFRGRAIIIALGMEHKKLDIAGEKEFLGRGVSYCAVCDGAFFKDKIVTVIGGADSAASVAIHLSKIAKKVYVIYRKHEMRCEPISLTRIKENKKIELIYFARPMEIIGDKRVNKIRVLVEESGESVKERLIETDGVFIEIGATPFTDVVKPLGVRLDCDGFIETDRAMKTSVEGVFAAGDNTNNFLKQMITAAGEGAIAAKSAYEFLRHK